MTPRSVERDERTTSVENAGYRLSYLFVSFGLLAIVAFRSWSRGEQPWDLVALVLLGGVVNAAYQGWHRVMYRRWVVVTVLTMIAAALVAGVMVLLRQ